MDVTARTGGGGRVRRSTSADPTAHEGPVSRSAQPDGGLALDSGQTFDEFYVGTRGQLLRQLTAMTADPELAKDAESTSVGPAPARPAPPYMVNTMDRAPPGHGGHGR